MLLLLMLMLLLLLTTGLAAVVANLNHPTFAGKRSRPPEIPYAKIGNKG